MRYTNVDEATTIDSFMVSPILTKSTGSLVPTLAQTTIVEDVTSEDITDHISATEKKGIKGITSITQVDYF